MCRWFSDYYGLKSQLVFATSLALTVSSDGLSYAGVATY